MGRDKLSLPWKNTTVLAATLARWSAVAELDEILLVRRQANPADQAARVRVLVNSAADEGMGSSLRLAAETLPAETEAVVIGLADMPEVASATIAALVAAWRPLGASAIVAPVFEGRRGHPVVFGASYVAALRELSGDAGARAILKQHAADLTLVPVADPGVVLDLDTPADLEARS
jgi:molybdenum cofactor cytidylyltransferase